MFEVYGDSDELGGVGVGGVFLFDFGEVGRGLGLPGMGRDGVLETGAL